MDTPKIGLILALVPFALLGCADGQGAPSEEPDPIAESKADAPTNIIGTVVDTFQGDIDPTTGNASIVYVKTDAGKVYGLIEAVDHAFGYYARKYMGKQKRVAFSSHDVKRIDKDRRAAFRAFDQRTGRFAWYYNFQDGALVSLEAGACLFGDVEQELDASPLIQIGKARTVRPGDPISDLEEKQLVEGLRILIEDPGESAPVTDAKTALAAVDDSEVDIAPIAEKNGSRAFVYYRFHMGDTPVGFMTLADSAHVVATMGDQDISDCSVLVP